MPGIFISYRRDESAGYAGRLYDRLRGHFGRDRLFMDIETIDPGVDFVEAIEQAVGACDVVLALIGQQWLASVDTGGRRRIDIPEDFVRLEIASALGRNIRVIPVLIRGASMPLSTELPDVLHRLARRQAFELSNTRFHEDVDGLIEILDRIVNLAPENPSQASAASSQPDRDVQTVPPEPSSHPTSSDASALHEAPRHEPLERVTPGDESEGEAVQSSAPHERHPRVTTTTAFTKLPWDAPLPPSRQWRKLMALAGIVGVIAVVVTLSLYRMPYTPQKPNSTSVESSSPGSPPSMPHTASSLPTLTNSIGMEFVLILAGEFLIGSHQADDAQRPPYEVQIRQSFYLGKYEVTQVQWEAVMETNPSHFIGDPNRPVERVSWEDVQEFIRRLNARERDATYRLPTEAEWEYAARAGSTTHWSFGDDPTLLGEYAWYGGNAGKSTHPVGQRRPNAWGLYDMHGNVWEWGHDWLGPYPLESVPTPQLVSSSHRVRRGGGWSSGTGDCRSAFRDGARPGYRSRNLGFRLLRVAP